MIRSYKFRGKPGKEINLTAT